MNEIDKLKDTIAALTAEVERLKKETHSWA